MHAEPSTDHARLVITGDSRSWLRHWPLVSIIALAVLARYAGLAQGLPHDFHWDERIYFHESLNAMADGMRRGSVVSANLPYLLMPVMLWEWLWLALSGGPADFAALVRHYIESPAGFVLAARVLWAATGVLAVVMSYRVALRTGGKRVALAAAFFLAGAFLHVEQSHFVKNDVPVALWMLLLFDRCLSIQQRGAPRDYLWAGAWLGLAAATRYQAGALVLALLLAHVTGPSRDGDGAAAGGGYGAHFRRLALAAAGAIVAFALSMPVLLSDPSSFVEGLARQLGARFAGIPSGDQPQVLFYLTEHLGKGLGEAFLILSIGGLALCLVRGTRATLLLAAFPLIHFAAINTLPFNFARYAVPLVPFLCIGAALALSTAVKAVEARLAVARPAAASPAGPGGETAPRRSLAAGILLAIGALLFSLPSLLNVARYDRYALAVDTRTLAREWFESMAAPGATVVVEAGESPERNSMLGPQIWPTAEQIAAKGPWEERDTLFWRQLQTVAAARQGYALTLVGAAHRTSREVNGRRVQAPVESVREYGRPDYFILINWRSAELRPGSTHPFWQSLSAEYNLAADFKCEPCFPEDYYAWRVDYPTLEGIPLLGGALLAGPEVRVFQRRE